jgi:hypothetical protein
VVAAACVYGLKAAESASAILRWRELIQSVAQGENVYNDWLKDGSFPYPPVAGLVLWPLTLLPPLAAGLTWFVLKVGMAAIAVRWSIRLAQGTEQHSSPAAIAVLLVLAGRPLLSDLGHGNINILILFLTTAGLIAFRSGRDWLAGGAIALAAAIKLTPILFLPYFAYKRQWRTVAWGLAGLMFFWVVVPTPIIGFQRNLWLLRAWYSSMAQPFLFEGKVETLQTNQSLPGIWLRLVTPSPGIQFDTEAARAVNLVNLDGDVALWCLKGMTLGLLALLAVVARNQVTNRSDWRLAVEYAVVFILMLMISERSWKHHFVTMTLPFAAIVAHTTRTDCGPRMRTALRLSLIAAFLLMASTSAEVAEFLVGENAHKYAQAYGLYGASAVVALVALSAIHLSIRSMPETFDEPLAR